MRGRFRCGISLHRLVLSGFVLARSLSKNPDPIDFFRHRLFRLSSRRRSQLLLFSTLCFQFGFYVGYVATFSSATSDPFLSYRDCCCGLRELAPRTPQS